MELSALSASAAFENPGHAESGSGLIRRIAQGSEAALAELYDKTSSLVHGLICRMIRDAATAEEVTLDVYQQVWRQASSYDQNRASITGWLFTIARSRAIDRIRSEARHRAVAVEDYVAIPDPSPTPEEHTDIALLRSRVQNGLMELPLEQREALLLAYFSGLSHSEIADRLKLPLGTVKTRIRLGMIRLRDLLDMYGGAR